MKLQINTYLKRILKFWKQNCLIYGNIQVKNWHTHMNILIAFKTIRKGVNKLKKEDFFSNLKNDSPDDNEIERKKFLDHLIVKSGKK